MSALRWEKIGRAFETRLGKDQVFVRPSVTSTTRKPLFEIRINGKLIGETSTAAEGKTVVERLAEATRRA